MFLEQYFNIIIICNILEIIMFVSQHSLIYVDTHDNTAQSLFFEMAFIYQNNLSIHDYIFSALMAIKMLVHNTPKAVIFYWTFRFFKHL